jgi:phosphatidylserine/phosphatidylglycerophosphate/cardiolipin synthase-like enzyme
MSDPHDWLLSSSERGNPANRIDDQHDGVAWTSGNSVEVLIDGRAYFTALLDVLCSARRGDCLYFTGLEGNVDELLAGPGTGLGDVFVELARNGVAIRGLVWRAHPGPYNQAANLDLAHTVNEAGGEVLLDNRIRRGGSHHQKLLVLRRSAAAGPDVAFLGGIDLAYGRHDDGRHVGDPQRALLAEDNYGPTPPWHDVQLQVHGPAVDDIAMTFRERWEDPSPLDVPSPWRLRQHRRALQPRTPTPLTSEPRVTPGEGPLSVQVLRTYPKRRSQYPFAPEGERSIARAYQKAFARAEHLIYLEDQYLWSYAATRAVCAALRRSRDLRFIAVIPKYPDPDGRILGAASDVARERVQRALVAAGGDRVAIYDLENSGGVPIYVHSKVCIVDDVWMSVGSDNLNRRSWTHDSESSCAIVNTESDPEGDTLARATRLRFAAEHLGRADVDALVVPSRWFDAFRDTARVLDAWHREGQAGPRPPGHVRVHDREHVGPIARFGLDVVHRVVLDPDGRPFRMRRSERY